MMVVNSRLTKRLLLKALFLALLMALLLFGVAQAVIQNRKLSGDLIDEGDVFYFKISPDGKHIVFLADANVNGQNELFSVHTIGGKQKLLSTSLSELGGVVDFQISPDSQWVVFFAGSGGINADQLFSVPIGGGTPVELYKAEIGNYFLSDVKISPDSSRVLFRDIFVDPRRDSLLSVPIAGGEVSPISAPDDWCYISYQITPDSQHVVYNQREAGCDFMGLYQNDLVGEDLITLDDHYVEEFKVTPDGEYVVFTQRTSDAVRELFSVPIGGDEKKTLNGPLVAGGYVSYDFDITPDSKYVIYRAIQSVLDMILLYRADVDGSGLSINLTPWGMFDPGGNVESFKITPNSLGVVYLGDYYENNRFDLFSVPITVSVTEPYHLSEGMIPGGDVVRYEITPNNLGVIFIADSRNDGVFELFGAIIDGSTITPLNLAHPSYYSIENFQIANNSQFVVYRAPREETGPLNLFFISSGGGVPIQLNPDPVFGGFVQHDFKILPDSKGVVYRADQETDDLIELFITYDFQMVFLPMIVK